MLRWKFIIPRLVILAVLAVAAWIAMNPVLRWGLIRGGQAATGAKVEISRLRSLLSRAEVQLSAIAVADAKSPLRNLFEADAAVLDVDTRQLLRRRFVVDEGSLTGIRLGTARQSSGTLPGAEPSVDSGPGFGDKVNKFGEEWLEDTARRLGDGLENDLQSVRLSKELLERWPQEYERLESQTNTIHDRGQRIARALKDAKANPLQAVEKYKLLLSDMGELRQEAAHVRQELSRLQQQMRMDQIAVDQARQHDWEYVQQRAKLARLDPEAVSSYLLGPEMGPRVADLLRWLQWGRAQLAAGKAAPPPATRGWDVLLPGAPTQPTWLVRRLLLSGGGDSDGGPFTFSGNLEGITSQPAAYGKPATLSINTGGALQLSIEAVMDHTTEVARDHIVIDLPDWQQPSRQLGSAESLAVNVGSGVSHLRADIDLEGNSLQGVVYFRQPTVTVRTEVSKGLGGKLVAERLTNVTSTIDEIDASLRLAGTLHQPRWTIDSNLGTQLAGGLHQVCSQEVENRQRQLMQKANEEIDRHWRRLETELRGKQEELLAKLELSGVNSESFQAEISNLKLPKVLDGEKLLRGILQR